jgi:hypothetical protein
MTGGTDHVQESSHRGSRFSTKKRKPKTIDPNKIVLEMDLLDKEGLINEMNVIKTDLGNLMQQDPAKLEPGEQIERVRRMLVLNELGVPIPKDNITGEIDIKALFAYELTTKSANTNQTLQAYTPLTTEKHNSSLLKDIKPLFPLIPNNSTAKKIAPPDEKYFQKIIREILEKKAGLSDFASEQKTDIGLQLKQGIFRERMRKANMYIDLTFKDVSESLMDEEILLKTYREQVRKEGEVKGKPLFPVKEHAFETKWRKMKNVKSHDGVEISKSGMLMGKEFQMRKQ